MRYRINLPEGTFYEGYNYVVVEAVDLYTARLLVVRATGVSVFDQGSAFVYGYVGVDASKGDMVFYYHEAPDFESWPSWIPAGAKFEDDEKAELPISFREA